MSKIRLLFMGTPEFAVAALSAIYETEKYEITVITTPDKPKGRGYELQPSPVKVFALGKGLPLYQPATLRTDDFFALLKEIDPDVSVVAAYGKILPKNVLDYPRFGCINIHGSLLPEYRGAAPIQRAIIDGAKVTGITVMKMDEGLDTGDILTKTEVVIEETDDFGTLCDKMEKAGADAIVSALPMILSGEITAERQDGTKSNYAAKIEKSDCVLDFSQPSKAIYDRIRGLSPFPLAYTKKGDGTVLKIARASLGKKYSLEYGSAVEENGKIAVVCGDGISVILEEIIPAGKKKMSSADYLRGHKLSENEIFCDDN